MIVTINICNGEMQTMIAEFFKQIPKFLYQTLSYLYVTSIGTKIIEYKEAKSPKIPLKIQSTHQPAFGVCPIA